MNKKYSCLIIILTSFFMANSNMLTVNKTLIVSSKSFQNNGKIPIKFSYKDKNISPNLYWSTGPKGTESYLILCNDVDAPTVNPWLHWLVFNIPRDITSLKEGLPKSKFNQAINDYGEKGWGGPNPPSGTHRYIFHVYALDDTLPIDTHKKVNQKKIQKMIDKHALAHGSIIATFRA